MGKYEAQTNNRWFSPEVRTWMYRVAVAVAALGVFYGIISGDESAVWLILVSTVLGGTSSVAGANVPKRVAE